MAAWSICALALFATSASAQSLSFEAESLTRTTSGVTATNDTDANASGGVRVTLNATSTGSWIQFTLPNVSAGTYTVQLAYKTNANRGQASFQADGAGFGSTLDQYASAASYPTANLGSVTFGSTGNHTLRMTVAGKNSASTSFTLSADKFILTPTGGGAVATPTFSPGSGTYTSAQTVSISTTTAGATIRYTVDGSTPTATGTVYTGPLTVAATTTIRAIATATSMTDSSVASATYTFQSGGGTMVFEAEGLARTTSGATATTDTDAAASGGARVTLNGTAVGAWVQFTLPGVPAGTYAIQLTYKTNGNRAIAAFQMDGAAFGSTIDQYAASATYPTVNLGTVTFATSGDHTFRMTATGKNSASSSYTLSADKITLAASTGGGTVATPAFNPPGGTYTSAQSVAITSTTPGASIRYTLDGTIPNSTTGTLYTGPVALSATATLRAIAYASGLTDSAVAASTYTINPGGSGPFRPFPQHVVYIPGSIKPSNVTQAQMDSAVIGIWNSWKSRYLKQSPSGANRYYVMFESNGDGVSEGHGYGMVLAVLMAGADAQAKTYFDGLYNFYKAHPSVNNSSLMAWKQNSAGSNIEGADSATDGDMDIAYSLLLADKQWGSGGAINYLQAAKAIINAIVQSDVNQSSLWNLKLGDWATGSQGTSTRPSDFMLDHLKAYRAATGDAKWDNVISATYGVCNTIFANNSASTGLLPDFVINSSGWKPAPANFLEGPDDGHYNYNSCRVPWRLGTDYLLTGDSRSQALLQKLNSWIKTKTGSNPANVKSGYNLSGTQTTSDSDNCFTIPFAVSAMIDSSNQAWLNALWTHAAGAGAENYYNDSIKLQSLIVVSGNWWAP
jgi:endo-1,4-beta-D-glucanase Y